MIPISEPQFPPTVSILSRMLIALLVIKEIEWYRDSELEFKFRPDTRMDAKLKIHIDLTVASPCRAIGADILDSTTQNVFSFGVLEEDDTWWDLCPRQQEHFDYVQSMNGYLREEWHSLTVSTHNVLLFSTYRNHSLVRSIGST